MAGREGDPEEGSREELHKEIIFSTRDCVYSSEYTQGEKQKLTRAILVHQTTTCTCTYFCSARPQGSPPRHQRTGHLVVAARSVPMVRGPLGGWCLLAATQTPVSRSLESRQQGEARQTWGKEEGRKEVGEGGGGWGRKWVGRRPW